MNDVQKEYKFPKRSAIDGWVATNQEVLSRMGEERKLREGID